MTEVVLKNLKKRYPNGFEAVKGVNLEISSGEFIALLGPSGCGKTTTLRMVAGLEAISEGELWIGGRCVNDVAPRDRGVAMVFQSYALYPHMTVFENMAFGLRLRKLPEAEIAEQIRDVAQRLGIEQLLDRKPAQMSGGQRQRVAMGRAIVRKPDVFLFDEPLSNLDARLRLKMRVELSNLHRTLGATSLYVTHDQVEAMTLADRIVLLKDGVVQQIGTPLELYGCPANRFVGEFIGSPTMNTLDCEITGNTVSIGSFTFAFERELANGRYCLGVRPQDVILTPSEKGTQHVEVSLVEPLGNETLVHCTFDDMTIVGRVDGGWVPAVGDVLAMALNAENLHVFDLTTGARV
ncbi:MAG: ABC transporter ATP-binding protein [Bradymonadia bacterium]